VQAVRVLHLTTEFPPIIYGGLGTAIGGLVRALARSGLDVAVLLIGSASGASYREFAPDLTVVARRRRGGGATIFEASWFEDIETLVRRVHDWGADLLHLHSFWLWPIAQVLRDRLGLPLVYTVHSLDRAEYELGAGPPQCIGQWTQQETVIYGADIIISLTKTERGLLTQYCPGVGDRIRIVGNGIEDAPLRRRALPVRGAGLTVLFSGRFVDRKGIWELIGAIGIVLAAAPNVRFVLAGGHRGCPAEHMETWLLPENLRPYRSQIHFTGWLTPRQMAAQYRTADILVVPSWYEPFGMVVLEGMIHGLTVAAAAVGGPAEILRDGDTGLLFAPCDARALARAILRLAHDPDFGLRLAEAGAREVRENWLWPCIVRKMQWVYDEALTRRNGRPWRDDRVGRQAI
jgi:glycogen synthase